jgi:hypothetical protein
MKAFDNYGLGVELDVSKIGEPEFVISKKNLYFFVIIRI